MESISYSNSQRAAIEHGKGPLLVLAGPGSGKTLVITHRVRYLIEELLVAPESILVLTFSRAAAKGMKERFYSAREKESGRAKCDQKITWGTFHSFFFYLLRTAYGYGSEQVAGEEERSALVREALERRGIAKDEVLGLSEAILSEIALVKQEKIRLELYYAKSCAEELFREVFAEYEAALGRLKKIDFEDMLAMVYELLSAREDIREACEKRYRYILVDEFQDINRLQYEIIRLIAGKSANLTVVGDDDQSVYRFRGAKPEIMLGFQKDYPEARKLLLETNFRSSVQIVEASRRLIENNTKRFHKEIRAKRALSYPVKILRFKNPISQAYALLRDIKAFADSGTAYKEIAVLYRTNIQPRLLIKLFLEHELPFWVRDHIPDIYEHWIAKDMKSYLRLALQMGGKEDLFRIINRPNRFIKREAFYGGSGIAQLLEYYRENEDIREKLERLRLDLSALRDLNTKRALKYIRQAIGYDKYIRLYAEERGIEEEDLEDVLNELEESASQYPEIAEWFSYMETYQKELSEAKRASAKGEQDGVRLMSFHSSKGLEYKIVYIIDANEGITPHKKARSIQELEEERRMFYVAMTRAKDRLFICSLESGFRHKAEPSRFLSELE